MFTKTFWTQRSLRRISWAVREIIVQIRCRRKDAEWVKNVDEVAEKKILSCGACVNSLKECDYKKTRNGSKNIWLIKKNV